MWRFCRTSRTDHRLPVLLASVGMLLSAPAAHAQSWQIDNISPVTSSGHQADPNSASGGRVNLLAVHPTNKNIIFAASEWGGLFRTQVKSAGDDWRRHWTPVLTHRPQVTWDVAFSPVDGDMLIVTSAFDGKVKPESGISVSRDGGRTWARPATAVPPANFCGDRWAQTELAGYGIAFDAERPQDIYVGTSCGLAMSKDNGASWRFVDPVANDNKGANGVYAVIVHHGGIVDICGDDGHLRSSTGGASFDVGASRAAGRGVAGGMCSLAASPDEADVLFWSVGELIYESFDGGASWTPIDNPDPQGRIPFVKVNDRTGAAFDLWFGDVSLYRASCTTPADRTSTARRCPNSKDSGGNLVWSDAQTGAHNDVGDIVFDPTAAVDACPLLFSNDGGVYYNDLSAGDCHNPQWQQPDTTVTALWLWDMAAHERAGASEEGVYIGQQDTGGFGSTDAGGAAVNWNSPECCDMFDVEAEKTRVVYTVCCSTSGRATTMHFSGETMHTGQEIGAYPPGLLMGFQNFQSVANYAANSYAVVTSSGIYFTTDVAAATPVWKALGVNRPANVCGVFASKDESGTPVFIARAGQGACYLGREGSLWRHEGATTTGAWKRVERNGKSEFGAFTVSRTDHKHLIANDVAGVGDAMAATTDGGTTWTTLPKLDEALIGKGAFVSEAHISKEGLGTYTQASLIAINPADAQMIVAGAHDAGVFLSLDGGTNWTLLSDPHSNNALRPHVSRPLFAHFESLGPKKWNIYIGARGRGVWRVTLTAP